MPIRPDVGDDIEFLDEIPVLTDIDLGLVDTEVDDLVQAPVPSLAEQWMTRGQRRGLARDLRQGVGGAA